MRLATSFRPAGCDRAPGALVAVLAATALLLSFAPAVHADPNLPTAPAAPFARAGIAPAAPVSIRGRDFEREVLRSKVPVVVEFWATWCGPCRKMEPRLEELAAAYGSELRVVRIDFDANRRLAARLDVERLPTLMVFNNGVEARRVGRTLTVAELRSEVRAVGR